MQLILHGRDSSDTLRQVYSHAFASAVELYAVAAYLTEWDSSLRLNPACGRFRLIVGSDFGITRKAACTAALRWLPARRKGEFLVAEEIAGFHPKAVFWREASGACRFLVGSSNLTQAAFTSNYEANVTGELDATAFERVRVWIGEIEARSVPVSEEWIERYREADAARTPGAWADQRTTAEEVVSLPLPTPRDMERNLTVRRQHLAQHEGRREQLLALFRRCASGEISSQRFYRELPHLWTWKYNRLQAQGWEWTGKTSDFGELARSFVRIVDAAAFERDDVVISEIDRLGALGVPTRRAFLSEMLCLQFPELYPVLNGPVRNYLTKVQFRAPKGATEGVSYVDLARKRRAALRRNPEHPAKNIAELDTVIWEAYG